MRKTVPLKVLSVSAYPLSSAGEGKVSQSPVLGTTFLSVFRAETEMVQIPQLCNLLQSRRS